MSKVALITGITGQDGSYLADFYWKKDMKCTVYYVGPRRLIPDDRTFVFG